jgi:hypothetical protein
MITNALLPSLFYCNHTADDETMAGPGSVEFCTHKHDERLDRSAACGTPKHHGNILGANGILVHIMHILNRIH